MTFRGTIPRTRVTLNGIAHRFGRRILFRDVNDVWEGGSSVAVVGSNGTGKSTLLTIIAGLLTPWRGGVEFEVSGKIIAREMRPFSVGMVAPYLQVYEGFSPIENLVFLFKARGIAGRPERRAEELIDMVGLAGRGHEHVSTFSSGMKQRVRLAAALVSDPPILLFDEALTNLDEVGRSLVYAIGDAHVDRGGLLVVATNDASEASRHSHRLDVEDYLPQA